MTLDARTASTDSIEQELIRLESDVARVRARQIELLLELAARQVATSDGCRTMAEWVGGRLDVSPETASTLVRTAGSLSDLPYLSVMLGAGELSFDRVVELSKLANPATEHRVADEALAWDVAGCAARWPAGDG